MFIFTNERSQLLRVSVNESEIVSKRKRGRLSSNSWESFINEISLTRWTCDCERGINVHYQRQNASMHLQVSVERSKSDPCSEKEATTEGNVEHEGCIKISGTPVAPR